MSLLNTIQTALDVVGDMDPFQFMRIHNINLMDLPLTSCEGVIKVGDCNSTIIIKKGLSNERKMFILWHEIGHFLLDYKLGRYLFKNTKNPSYSERRANIFACMKVLKADKVKEDTKQALTQNGCPENIADDFLDFVQNLIVETETI